ncbi:glycosyltransferase family 2 protein [Chloroflexota bacterium]
MNDLNVSVVICTYTKDRIVGVREAIDSAKNQSFPAYEIILVIDNNNALYELVSGEYTDEVRIILSNEESGVSAARNAGIMEAKGEIIAFLDDDTVADRDWLAKLIPHYRDSNVVAVGGSSILDWENGSAPFWFPWEFDWILGGTEHKQLVTAGNETYTISDPNMSFRREALIRAGLWQVGMGQQMRKGKQQRGGDIAEVCYRIRQDYPQCRFIFEHSAIMYHKLDISRARLKYYLKCAFLEGNTRARVDQVTNIRNKGKSTLPSHQTYLSNLLKKRLYPRFLKIYRPASAAQLFVITLTLTLMGGGYAQERVFK